jgi:hypothetical protein
LTKITQMLYPYPSELMNAYPVAPTIKDYKNNYKELLNPIGERIYKEFEIQVSKKLIEKGWGNKKKDPENNWGDKRNQSE